MTEPRISVVVPTYNRLDTLSHVIPSLLAQDLRRGEFEVLVADSNSTDGTREFLAGVAAEHPGVRHLPGPYTGRAMARNAGIAAARAPIVLFTDADILASPDLLSRHLAHHDAGPAQAVVGMEVQVSSFEDYLAKRAHAALRAPLHGTKPKRLSWLYFLTGNASVPKAELDQVGRFDEDFTGYGHEDLELGYRLQRGRPADRLRAGRGELPLAPRAVAGAAAEVRAGRPLDGALPPQARRLRRAAAPGHDAAVAGAARPGRQDRARSRPGSRAARSGRAWRARSRTNTTTSPESRPPYVDSSTDRPRVSCGALTAADVDRTVELNGWVHRRRDHGGLIFIDLRDRDGHHPDHVRPLAGRGVPRGRDAAQRGRRAGARHRAPPPGRHRERQAGHRRGGAAGRRRWRSSTARRRRRS